MDDRPQQTDKTDGNVSSANEPVVPNVRADALPHQPAAKDAGAENKGPATPPGGPPPAPQQNNPGAKAPVQPVSKPNGAGNPQKADRLKRNKRRSLVVTLSFFLAVIVPTILVALYYSFVAVDQFRVETQFSVRGSNASPFAELGLNALPGVTTQNNDSYIVVGYIDSRQVISDIREKLDVDLRQFYSKPEIDLVYRIDPDMTLADFERYWRRMTVVEFNSTTGNSTLIVYAFTAEDAKRISELVLEVSQELVNNLSSGSREQLIATARSEVDRAERRLAGVRQQLTALRNREQAVDPAQIATVQTSVISTLEQQLADLKTRRSALRGSLSADAPSVRVIDRQIAALEAQLTDQRNRVGTGQDSVAGGTADGSLSTLVSEYTDLSVDLEFATTAYTTSLASLETAIAEAQKQQRYFATFRYPYLPDSTIYPRRILNTLLAGFGFFLAWVIGFFFIRSAYDHSI